MSSLSSYRSEPFTLPEKLESDRLVEIINANKTLKFQDLSHEIHLKSETISEIIESYIPEHDDDDTPFFLMDLSTVVEKVMQWKKLMPRVEPHYAVKCNSDVLLLKVLASFGVKFDCASQGEIETVLKLGHVSGEDIIFANPCKPKAHLLCAKKNGVKQMTFDNLQELEKIRIYYPDAELYLRIGVDDSAALCQLSSKFGANLSSCPKLLKSAIEMGLNVKGLSFHVGSGQQTCDAYVDALDRARGIFDLAESLGAPLSVLDIGGGFPGEDDEEAFFGFEQISVVINKKLNDLFPSVRIIAEPGRYFAAACCTLATKITAIRDQTDSESPVDYFYYLNDGVYGSFNNILYDHATVIPKLLRTESSTDTLYRSTIFGPSCDGLDTILKNYPVPKLNVHDWIYWQNMGAYTICAAASFNGFPLPNVHYIWRTNKN